MIIPVAPIAQIGLVKDTPAQRIPLHAWTDVRNVMFREGFVKTAAPYVTATITLVNTRFVELFQGPTDTFTVYGSNVALQGNSSSASGNITRTAGAYTMSDEDYWNACMFNGFAIFCNGVDVPQSWNPLDVTNRVINLPTWPSTVRAKVVRGFKNFLVALDVTKGAARDIRLVKWSHSADPNTLPSSWDETDASKEAGEVSLHSGQDGLIDGLTLGNFFILYTELQTWAMKYVGGQNIFAFDRLFPDSGLLAQSCAQEFGAGHFAVTQSDIIVHNGSTINSVADGSVRKWFFNNLSPAFYKMTRVVKMLNNREMWICFPQSGSALELALIWNWRFNTWTVRELPAPKSATSLGTVLPTAPDTWELSDGDWTVGTTTWGEGTSFKRREVFTMAGGTLVHRITEGVSGVAVPVMLLRAGISHVDVETQDEYNFKSILAVRPSIEGPDGTEVTIRSGHQENVNNDVTWDEVKIFTIGTDVEVQINAVGRYLAVEFTWTETTELVQFYGYALDIVPLKEGL